jgi:hypothetical protein
MNREEEYEEAHATLERLGAVMARRSASVGNLARGSIGEWDGGASAADGGGHELPAAGDGGGGGGRPTSPPARTSAAADVLASLERAKFALLADTARQRKALGDLHARCADVRAKVDAQRARLSATNGMFLRLGPAAAARAPRQQLGAAHAVAGTQRIVARELARARNESGAVAAKLNRARERNAGVRAAIDSARREAVTFRGLFGGMGAELDRLKARAAATQAAIDEGYNARARALEDQRQLARAWEVDKLDAAQEWAVYGQAIAAADAVGAGDGGGDGGGGGGEGGASQARPGGGAAAGHHGAADGVASGLLTQQEEDELRRKIRRGQDKMDRDRKLLAVRVCASGAAPGGRAAAAGVGSCGGGGGRRPPVCRLRTLPAHLPRMPRVVAPPSPPRRPRRPS